jgi:hypothetical protein
MAMMQKKFVYEYESDPQNRITFDYSPEADEKLSSSASDDGPVLYMNRPGMLTLAKILIKMAEGDYKEGFHVHLRQDFNADLPERLTVILSPDDTPVS